MHLSMPAESRARVWSERRERGAGGPLHSGKSARAGRHGRGFFFQAGAGIRDYKVTGVQTCALPILLVTCIFFLWMFFAAATLERTADLGWISAVDRRSAGQDARAIAYEFAARWRHGMSGNSPLYKIGRASCREGVALSGDVLVRSGR